ncbi:hypothetical protein ACFXMT_16735 [Streptomyces mirabilis]|uniref:hypothetical protein n=1 Tax=Streptomyces mirabilis TaxID=68239 RepID=UPI0036ACB7D4
MAKKAADAEEAKLLAGTKKAPRERITFGAYVNRWYAAQDLAASIMQNYRRNIDEHLLPAFEDSAVADILSTDIAAREKHERAVPYAASSVKAWRATLHLIRPAAVAEPTRLKVLEAVSDLGYIRNAASGELAAHWRRSGFATWLFRPAATGRCPGRGSQEERPVPVVAEPWPGIPARGRGASKQAEVCWVPIAPGLTPHGLRHTHKTLMGEVGTPPKLMDERMGHEDGSVPSRYDHITPGMRQALMTALTGMWEEASDARRTMSLGSPVAALDALLKAR